MSYYPYPKDWKDLQRKTAKLLCECGFQAQCDKAIKTVRGFVNVDVYVENATVIPKSVYLIECKCWNRSITQTVIHSFRTIVSDYGANHGYIIAKKGFQKGAYNASNNTNIVLLNWDEFIVLFKENWKERMFWRIWNRFNNIAYYRGEYVGDIFEKTHISKELKPELRKEYYELLKDSNDFLNDGKQFPDFLLMIKNDGGKFPLEIKIRKTVKTFENESQLFDKIIFEQKKIILKFDKIFGNKIRRVNEIWG